MFHYSKYQRDLDKLDVLIEDAAETGLEKGDEIT